MLRSTVIEKLRERAVYFGNKFFPTQDPLAFLIEDFLKSCWFINMMAFLPKSIEWLILKFIGLDLFIKD